MTTPTTPSPELQPADAGLLDCPFCGGKAEIVHIEEGENAGGSCVCCTRCQASSNVEFEFKENFVSRWNRRAPAPQAQPDARAVEGEPVAWRWRFKTDVDGDWTIRTDGPSYHLSRPDIEVQFLYLSAPAADDGWRDIADYQGCGPVLVSTAPDSPKYLFSEPVSAFRDVTGVWRCLGSRGGSAETALQPTHWRPLPAPPVALHPAAPTDEVGK